MAGSIDASIYTTSAAGIATTPQILLPDNTDAGAAQAALALSEASGNLLAQTVELCLNNLPAGLYIFSLHSPVALTSPNVHNADINLNLASGRSDVFKQILYTGVYLNPFGGDEESFTFLLQHAAAFARHSKQVTSVAAAKGGRPQF